MRMKYRKDCECCWHRSAVYVKSLNKGLIQALGKLIEFYNLKHRPANLQKDLNLTHNQYCGFQQLQYFGLVDHDVKNSRVPTPFWMDFFDWQIPCENRVATLNNKRLPFDHECRETDKKKWKVRYVWEFDSQYRYKSKEEYQLEKWSKREVSEQVLFDFW